MLFTLSPTFTLNNSPGLFESGQGELCAHNQRAAPMIRVAVPVPGYFPVGVRVA